MSCCHKCPRRYPGCHSKCEDWSAECEANNQRYAEKALAASAYYRGEKFHIQSLRKMQADRAGGRA